MNHATEFLNTARLIEKDILEYHAIAIGEIEDSEFTPRRIYRWCPGGPGKDRELLEVSYGWKVQVSDDAEWTTRRESDRLRFSELYRHTKPEFLILVEREARRGGMASRIHPDMAGVASVALFLAELRALADLIRHEAGPAGNAAGSIVEALEANRPDRFFEAVRTLGIVCRKLERENESGIDTLVEAAGPGDEEAESFGIEWDDSRNGFVYQSMFIWLADRCGVRLRHEKIREAKAVDCFHYMTKGRHTKIHLSEALEHFTTPTPNI